MGTVVLLFSCEAVTSFKMRYLVGLISFLWILNLTHAKDGKLLPFQIIKFPNDPCDVSSTKNGTCYTSEECSDKGGTSIGSCAEGYGVCCTFSIGCGGSSSENCTYVEISSPSAGMCNAQICPTTTNICQIRLDFDTFVITGPSTVTVSVGLFLGGEGNVAGVAQMDRGQCKSDTFAISNAPHIPVVCGTLTGEHMYIDASTDCNNLEFVFGQTAVGLTTLATRSITIKASQLACGDSNLAPSGCSQYYGALEAQVPLKVLVMMVPHLIWQIKPKLFAFEGNQVIVRFVGMPLLILMSNCLECLHLPNPPKPIRVLK